MYTVEITIRSGGKIISIVKQVVTTTTLRALRAMHGAVNITICL